MIQMQTNLDVADNSGARKVQCIKVLGGSKRKYASVGDIIVVSVKEAIPRGRVRRAMVRKAVVVRNRQGSAPRGCTAIRFVPQTPPSSSTTTTSPSAPGIFGPVVRELRAKNFMKIISLVGPEVL